MQVPDVDERCAPRRSVCVPAFELVGAAAIVFLLLQILMLGYGRDQAIFAVVGRTVAEGGMPYRDAWDIKPPGIYLIYALARLLFGSGPHAIRIVEIAAIVGGVISLVMLGRRWWNSHRLGLGAALIWVLVYAQMDYWHTAQAESFCASLTAVLLAVAPLVEGARRPLWRWAAAGLLSGAMILLKPHFGLAALVLLVFGWFATPVSRARATLAWLAGAFIPCGACLLWLGRGGGLAGFWEMSSAFLPGYTALSWNGVGPLTVAYRVLTEWWYGYSSLVFVGVLLLLVFRPALPPASLERRTLALLVAVLLVHLLGIMGQGKLFPYHFGAIWPVVALLAAWGIRQAWLRVAPRGRLAMALFVAALLLVTDMRALADGWASRFVARLQLLGAADLDPARVDALTAFNEPDSADRRAVATLIAQHTPADSTLLVWGFEPVLHEWSHRRPASRFFTNQPLRTPWYQARARELFLQDIQRRLPHAIVVAHGDVLTVVTGDHDDSAAALAKFKPLAELVAQRYTRVATQGRYEVFALRSAGP